MKTPVAWAILSTCLSDYLKAVLVAFSVVLNSLLVADIHFVYGFVDDLCSYSHAILQNGANVYNPYNNLILLIYDKHPRIISVWLK